MEEGEEKQNVVGDISVSFSSARDEGCERGISLKGRSFGKIDVGSSVPENP